MKTSNQYNELKTPLWVTAQSKQNINRKQKITNALTRKHYFDVLNQMKQLYKTLGNELAFERDYKLHAGDKPNSLHCFLTKDFYWHLCCEDDYDFAIHLSIGNCVFSQDFSVMFKWLPNSVRVKIKYFDVPIMFERSKRLQESQFFTILNG